MRLHDRMKDGKLTNEEKADTAKEILELTEKIKELQEALDKEKNNGNNN
jgi:signal transduction histidine kinase